MWRETKKIVTVALRENQFCLSRIFRDLKFDGVRVFCDTLLAKAPLLVDNCMFWDRTYENVAGGSSCLRTNSSLGVDGQLRCSLQQLSRRPSLQRSGNVGLQRDSDLTGSVDRAQCCTCIRQPSQCIDAERLNPLKERLVVERQWAWTVGKTRRTTLLSIKTQLVKSRHDTFSWGQ